MMAPARLAALALSGLVLMSCSSGQEGGSAALMLDQVQRLRGGGEGANRVTATDAQLRAYPQDLILVEIPSKDSSAGLVRQAVNRDSVTWVAPDGVAVTLRGGQVVGTAGIGDDLTSAAVPDIRRVRGPAVRDLYHLGGDEIVRRDRFACTIMDAGAESVAVAGLSYPARRIVEECRGEDGAAFRNLYWVQADGLVRKSRQWVGPEIGYLVIDDVHGGRGL